MHVNNRLPIVPYLLEAEPSRRCMLRHKQLAPSYRTHSHDYLELELFTEGSGRQWINGVQVPFSPGSLFLLTPGDHHRLESDTPAQVLTIHLLPGIPEILGLPEVTEARACVLNREDFALFLRELEPLLEDTLPWQEPELLAAATRLIVRLLRGGTVYPLTKPERRLQHVLNYIRLHHTDPQLRLSRVAGECSLSETYFSTVFSETVGCHFTEYLTQCRLQHACELLESTEKSVTEVGYECGFSGLSHFFRCFRADLGCTPGQYRERHRR